MPETKKPVMQAPPRINVGGTPSPSQQQTNDQYGRPVSTTTKAPGGLMQTKHTDYAGPPTNTPKNNQTVVNPQQIMDLTQTMATKSQFNPAERYQQLQSAIPQAQMGKTMTYDAAKERASEQIQPLYQDALNKHMKQAETDAIRRGFFGQLPTEGLKGRLASENAHRQSSTIAGAANEMVNRSQSMAGEQYRFDQQMRQQEISRLGDMYSQADAAQQRTFENVVGLMKFARDTEQQDFIRKVEEAALTGYFDGNLTAEMKMFMDKHDLAVRQTDIQEEQFGIKHNFDMAQANFDNKIKEAMQTGYYDGILTKDVQQWLATFKRDSVQGMFAAKLQEAGITGKYDGNLTADYDKFLKGLDHDLLKTNINNEHDKEMLGIRLNFDGAQAALDRAFKGQQADIDRGIAERNQRFLNGIQDAKLTGVYNGNLTQDAQMFLAEFGLKREMFDWNKAMDTAQLKLAQSRSASGGATPTQNDNNQLEAFIIEGLMKRVPSVEDIIKQHTRPGAANSTLSVADAEIMQSQIIQSETNNLIQMFTGYGAGSQANDAAYDDDWYSWYGKPR